MADLTSELMKRVSSNLIRAQHYEQEGNSKRELQHLLWASRDIDSLLLQWNDCESEIDDHTAMTYAKSGIHIAERIQALVAGNIYENCDMEE